MPTVPPRYSSQVRQERLPGVRLNPGAPDGAFGGQTKAIEASMTIFERERQKANEIAVMDADRMLGEFENQMLYSEKGVLNRRGRDAFGAPDEVRSEFQRVQGEIFNSLSNDEQKLAFQKYSESRRRDIDRVVQRHVSQEIKAYDDQTTESFVANELQAALFNYKDPERIAHSVTRIETEFTKHAARNGLPPEWTRQKIEEANSKIHAGVVSRMLANGDDRTASAYYHANKDDIRGQDAITLEKALEEGSLRGESQRRADTIIAEHGTKDDRDAALREARDIKDPKLRDAVETRINQFFTGRHYAETERRNKLFIGATNIVDRTGDVTKIDAMTWSQLSLEQRRSLQAYAKEKTEGIEPVLHHPTWVEFTYKSEDQLAAMSEAEFMEKYYPKLDKAHRDRGLEMMRLARAAKTKGGGKDPSLASTVTFKDQAKMTLQKAGIIKADEEPSKWNEETARRYTIFQDEAWRAIQQYELSELKGQRKATGLEMQQIMDKILIDKVFVDEWGGDPEVPAVFVTDEQRGDIYVPFAKVPKEIKIEAVNLAKSIGNVPAGMSQADAEKMLARRIERAYAARLARGTRQEIIDIIRGHN